ncbi:DUF1028 domain-containing protein [Myxococcus sp. K15C18031901]|uniref:DUF1028 domain-containing protein n=1 Tax=Myxococcus dinghuensis TaxID=2906761 RepID=UPI0020A8160F|nr:DUF1028 domain-containing protein [Myxococcus dinghuensis]MCP3098281.1 DUF1028 domain-containing protein [Myxococcus dinghuensis]
MKPSARQLLLASALWLSSAPVLAAERSGTNPGILGTRAVVACDPVEKSCGMAVISFPSGVSSLVPYGRSDIAVATMALPSVDAAQAIIARVDAGEAPQAAIDWVATVDPYASIRQLAAVKLHPDGSITLGQRSGSDTSAHTCSVKGDTFVVQANNMSSPDMCRAMAFGFRQAKGSLPQRLYASLKAGALVGGDRNGERSGVIRVWNTTSETAFYTHVLAESVVHGSMNALETLGVQLNRYQAVIAEPFPGDLAPLDAESIKVLKHALHRLGYYRGPMNGAWSDAAEQALYDFNWNNLFFLKPTVVVDGKRKVDGVLLRFIREADLAALAPATPPAQ